MSGRPAPDTYGLADAAATFPERLPDVCAAAQMALAEVADAPVGSVALFGLGTGGLGADAVAALVAPDLPVPCWVGHGGELPGFVGPETLFFALSASGGTDETTAAAAEAVRRGATVVAVGGDTRSELSRLATASALTWCPRGETGARTVEALAATMVPVLVALGNAGLTPDAVPRLDAVAAVLARRRDAFVGPQGHGALVATRIGRTIPLVYGSEGVDAVAARWWKARVNLNAKAPAFAAAVPACTYDELAGWGQGGDVTRQVVTLVLFRRRGEPPPLARLFEAVAAECDEVMADVVEVRAGGDDLTRFFELALLGELVSLELAGREGVDPGPVPGIEQAHAG